MEFETVKIIYQPDFNKKPPVIPVVFI